MPDDQDGAQQDVDNNARDDEIQCAQSPAPDTAQVNSPNPTDEYFPETVQVDYDDLARVLDMQPPDNQPYKAGPPRMRCANDPQSGEQYLRYLESVFTKRMNAQKQLNPDCPLVVRLASDLHKNGHTHSDVEVASWHQRSYPEWRRMKSLQRQEVRLVKRYRHYLEHGEHRDFKPLAATDLEYGTDSDPDCLVTDSKMGTEQSALDVAARRQEVRDAEADSETDQLTETDEAGQAAAYSQRLWKGVNDEQRPQNGALGVALYKARTMFEGMKSGEKAALRDFPKSSGAHPPTVEVHKVYYKRSERPPPWSTLLTDRDDQYHFCCDNNTPVCCCHCCHMHTC